MEMWIATLLVATAILAPVVVFRLIASLGDRASERRLLREHEADQEAERVRLARESVERDATRAAMRREVQARVAELTRRGGLSAEQGQQVVAEDWPPKLLDLLESGTLRFEECSAVWRREVSKGLSPLAVALLLGKPDRETTNELKTKTKVTWTYYEDPLSRRGLIFKGVFDDGHLVDFTLNNDWPLRSRQKEACIANFGETVHYTWIRDRDQVPAS